MRKQHLSQLCGKNIWLNVKKKMRQNIFCRKSFFSTKHLKSKKGKKMQHVKQTVLIKHVTWKRQPVLMKHMTWKIVKSNTKHICVDCVLWAENIFVLIRAHSFLIITIKIVNIFLIVMIKIVTFFDYHNQNSGLFVQNLQFVDIVQKKVVAIFLLWIFS